MSDQVATFTSNRKRKYSKYSEQDKKSDAAETEEPSPKFHRIETDPVPLSSPQAAHPQAAQPSVEPSPVQEDTEMSQANPLPRESLPRKNKKRTADSARLFAQVPFAPPINQGPATKKPRSTVH